MCYLAIQLKNRMGYDDTLDVFGIHGIAGIVGAIGLTFLLRPDAARPPMVEQLWYQAEGVLASLGYSGVVSLVLVVIVDKLFKLRLDDPGQMAGMDQEVHGEHAYGLLNMD